MVNVEKAKSSFQLIGHVIQRFNMKNEFLQILDNDANLIRSISADYEIKGIELNENGWIGSILLHVKCTVRDKKKHKISISSTIEGVFGAPSDMEEASFVKMLGINGCASLYSIMRSFIISVTGQSLHAGKIVIPMLNFFELKEQKDLVKKKPTMDSGKPE